MEKKHDLTFCPECGVKLDGDEIICSVCGYKLAELHPVPKIETPVVPPPVVEAPVTPPPVVESISSTLVCPSCGAKVSDLEMFCNNCGSRLTVNEEKKPVMPPPPPPAVSETPVPPPPVVPHVTQDNLFCASCGAKVSASEVFCNNCGVKLEDAKKQSTAPPPPPPPPVYPDQANTPVTPQPVYQQSSVTPELPKKKGMSTIVLILIIVFGVIIIGGGTAALLQYTGTINVPFLAKMIPSKQSSDDTQTVQSTTGYYVVHSFAMVRPNQWEAVVSSVIVSNQQFNNKDGAINQYKKAMMKKYPKNYNIFTNSVLCEKFENMPDAQNCHSSLLNSYRQKGYMVKGIDFKY